MPEGTYNQRNRVLPRNSGRDGQKSYREHHGKARGKNDVRSMLQIRGIDGDKEGFGMSKRDYIVDTPIVGHDPVSYGAQAAIARVGKTLHGKGWEPGRHLAQEKKPRLCMDCGTEIVYNRLRCVPCDQARKPADFKIRMDR